MLGRVKSALEVLSWKKVAEAEPASTIETRRLCGVLPKGDRLAVLCIGIDELEVIKAELDVGNHIDVHLECPSVHSCSDATFDAVITQDETIFCESKLSSFEEILRILKPGGKLLFAVGSCLNSMHSPAVNGACNNSCYHESNSDVVMGSLLQAGFYDVEISALSYLSKKTKPVFCIASKDHLSLI
ncbi:MAG: class I SAM-dependent methyltransferase [Gammaproteobacteria bacterium]|nr:class I SAM-dependent methyltransferase [Gammaproteobacteria bacterium]